MADDIIEVLIELFLIWTIAGAIVFFLNLGWIFLTGSFTEIITELMMIAIFEGLPFPFNVLLSGRINPIALVLQVVLFIVILIIFEAQSQS